MADNGRTRLLDPLDRISEILFGLIMAVTIVGSLSIATAGRSEVRTVMLAALGCNLAWGLVDAIMYLMRTLTERTRIRGLARRVLEADRAAAHRLIEEVLPPHVLAITGAAELDGMRSRLPMLQVDSRPVLRPRDWLEAFGILLLVVIATFPVVLPFLLTSDQALAMSLSRWIAVLMLFSAGFALGRYAGVAKPVWTGFVMAVLGVVLIGVVKALGG
jgi:hypothetical protein